MPSPERFGLHIRNRRARKGLTLRDFALATELDVIRLSQLERHATTKPPARYEVKAIAQVLDLDPGLLLRLSEDFAPDMKAIRQDQNPLKDAAFVCRTTE